MTSEERIAICRKSYRVALRIINPLGLSLSVREDASDLSCAFSFIAVEVDQIDAWRRLSRTVISAARN